MTNTYRQQKESYLASLSLKSQLSFVLELNVDQDKLSCIICGKGSEEAPEYTVTMRTATSTITQGIHECCRKSHTESRYSIVK